MYSSAPTLLSFVSFLAFTMSGNRLIPTNVFTSLALFNMLITPLNSFPAIINNLSTALVSLNRMEKFFNLENLDWFDYYDLKKIEEIESENDVLIEVKNAEFDWKSETKEAVIINQTFIDSTTELNKDENHLEPNLLKNISFKFRKNQLIGVVGKVGCGKTSLIHSILGEIEKCAGNVFIEKNQLAKGLILIRIFNKNL